MKTIQLRWEKFETIQNTNLYQNKIQKMSTDKVNISQQKSLQKTTDCTVKFP